MRALRRRLTRLFRRPQAGSASVEIVILAPFIGLVILALVAMGRIAIAQQSVQNIATAAAREVSLSRTPAQAERAAQDGAQQAAAISGMRCQSLEVSIDPGGLNVPIGVIGTAQATVSCVVPLADLGVPGLPGSRTITAVASSPVDPYRERP